MNLKGEWFLHPSAQTFFDPLEEAGFRAFFVGGAVRDDLMGINVHDIDIATDASPEDVSLLAQKAGLKAVPTGIKHGTITVISECSVYEVTTFRRDLQTDGRHAKIAFTSDLDKDAARRDFTINALYANRQGKVLDPLGTGLPDLYAKRLRFIGDAHTRIREDYLRILRFFRFYAHYGNAKEGPDQNSLAACVEEAEGLESLSRERVGSEMRKLLSASDPSPAIATMAGTGILARILPGANALNLALFEHFAEFLSLAPDPIHRLAALGGEGSDTKLRLSRVETKRLFNLCNNLTNTTSAGELGYLYGQSDAKAILALRAAILGHNDLTKEMAECFVHEIITGSGAVFPINANDLPYLSGATLGKKLKQLKRRWIDQGFHLESDDYGD